MAQRVRIPHRRLVPFVRHTTPHSGGTLREVSYSVRLYYTGYFQKCKEKICIFRKNFLCWKKLSWIIPRRRPDFVGIPREMGIK